MYDSQNPLIARAIEYLEIAFRFILLNFLWLLSIAPIAAVFFYILQLTIGLEEFPWVLILIPIVLASPASGGLYYATNQMAHGRDAGATIYWEGIKSYVWPSYRWGIMNFVVAFLFSLNIWFYDNATFQLAPYIRVVFIVGAVFWAVIQMYTFPFMIEQEEPSLKTALRNSLLAVARHPLRSFGVLLLVLGIAFISTYVSFLLWILVSVSLIAYLSNKNMLVVLEKLIAKDKEIQEHENKEEI
jgi:hypothetical protein